MGRYDRDEYERHPVDEAPRIGFVEMSCPKCGGKMQVKNGPFGEFMGCMRFPVCKGTRHINTGVDNTPDPTASDSLKKLRMKGHSELNRFCTVLGRSRQSAYNILSKHMGIDKAEAHFGMFNEMQCVKAIDIFRSQISSKVKQNA